MSQSITIGELCERIAKSGDIECRVMGDSNVEVSRITHDSRQIQTTPKPDNRNDSKSDRCIFVCLRGEKVDGHSFANTAVKLGASAIVVEQVVESVLIPQLVVADSRKAMGHIASALYDYPSSKMTMVAITGTNGKTTIAQTLGTILSESGRTVKVIGTLSGARTTPEATDLQEILAKHVDLGTEFMVMEVSSHALELSRVAGITFDLAIFTNLSQDHLDFHGNMDAYLDAKRKLFTTKYAQKGIVNVDAAPGQSIASQSEIPIVPTSAADLVDVKSRVEGVEFTYSGAKYRFPLAGNHNVANAYQAIRAAIELGISTDDICRGLEKVTVKGRFERIETGKDFSIIVDFAHTPDGVELACRGAKELVGQSRLIVVLGAGGDRDKSKRSQMGANAIEIADVVIFTSDNPRSESPGDIVAEMVNESASTNYCVELDRRVAIFNAISMAKSGDLVLILGKGHEQGQEILGKISPFDDAQVARQALELI